jgi:hypothetical protein
MLSGVRGAKVHNSAAAPVAAAGSQDGRSEHNGLLGRLASVAGDIFAGGGNSASGHGSNDIHGAPGPIAGAGLPLIALGAGIYWVVRRVRRKKADRVS